VRDAAGGRAPGPGLRIVLPGLPGRGGAHTGGYARVGGRGSPRDALVRPAGRSARGAEGPEAEEALADHVIICGYGENGRRLAALLRQNNLPYVIIDVNSRAVRAARA